MILPASTATAVSVGSVAIPVLRVVEPVSESAIRAYTDSWEADRAMRARATVRPGKVSR